MILDVNEILSRYIPSESNLTIDQFESLDSNITSLILPNWSCNDVNYKIFDISRFTLLELLEIGDDSFGSIETFLINNLSKLRSLKIGSNSFTQVNNLKIGSNLFSEVNYTKWDNDKTVILSIISLCQSQSFHILNCESLESIEIGVNSFSDFGGEFELSNLKSLKSIKIGSIEMDSRNFVWSSFRIRGILYNSIYKWIMK